MLARRRVPSPADAAKLLAQGGDCAHARTVGAVREDGSVAQLTGFRIISPDLPGFGGSATFQGRPHDIEAYAAAQATANVRSGG